jgi:hypothetical protein
MNNASKSFFCFAILVSCFLLDGCSSQTKRTEAVVTPAVSMSKVVASAIRGDLTNVVPMLSAVDSTKLTADESQARECMLARFAKPFAPSARRDLPPAVAELIAGYQTYWHSQLRKTQSESAAESVLRTELIRVLRTNGEQLSDDATLDQLSDAIVPFIERNGMYALTGVTSPYRELMIWRTQDEKQFPITLTEGRVDVAVAFLDDFVVTGWLHEATCGMRSTGGWATNEKLFALKSRYDLSSESFTVSYLSHEGQHFFDYKLFPVLEQPELEYRAKLAEIIATQTDAYLRELLSGFADSAAYGLEAPHSHAEYWLIERLQRKTGVSKLTSTSTKSPTVAALVIRNAAKELLIESSDELRNLGAATAKSFLP